MHTKLCLLHLPSNLIQLLNFLFCFVSIRLLLFLYSNKFSTIFDSLKTKQLTLSASKATSILLGSVLTPLESFLKNTIQSNFRHFSGQTCSLKYLPWSQTLQMPFLGFLPPLFFLRIFPYVFPGQAWRSCSCGVTSEE